MPKKVLLTSVFGPYGVDDAYGRKENVMELFHNQVTREQGLFSLRFHHPSFALYFIAENLRAPAVVLDFPSEKRFVRELRHGYDYVGISFIAPNFIKAKRMAELVRRHSPRTRIVLGGHGTRVPEVPHEIPHDHICNGEGVRWFRNLLGEDPDRPLKHPAVPSGFEKRLFGVPLKTDSAVLLPGVGCPNACRFCCTSHFFDRRYTPYFDTGQELFDICQDIERKLGFRDFFVMDENFLKRPDRARELVALMEKHNRRYQFGIFSSAEAISQLGAEFLARLGVHFLWMGVESKFEVYEKNRGIDLKALIRDLRDHGVSVLASGILFLEHHDPETLWEDIRFLVDMQSDFVQFMQLGPLPTTHLYQDFDRRGLLRKDLPYEEWHGQHQIWFRHPHFTGEDSDRLLRAAFQHDFDVQGSSYLRLSETTLRGARRLGASADPWLRARGQSLRQRAIDYRPGLAVLRRYAHNGVVRSLTERLAALYEDVLGPVTTLQTLKAKAAMLCATAELARIKTGRHMFQPKTHRSRYRMSLRHLVEQRLQGRSLAACLRLDVDWQVAPVLVRLEGMVDEVNAGALARRIRRYLRRGGEELTLVLDSLESIDAEALRRLLVRIRKYHGRVRVVFREGAEAIRQAIEALPQSIRDLFPDLQPIPA